MSDFIELRVDTDHPENIPNVLCEAKIDGFKASWDGSNLISERGIVRNDRFPHLVAELRQIPWKVRGEVAVPFGNVLKINKKENWPKARIYIFDMLEWQGQDTRSALPADNRRLIEDAFATFATFAPQMPSLRMPFKFRDFQTGWAWIIKHNLEGLVLKELSGAKTYKVKYMREEKLPVVGFTPGSVKGCFQVERKGVVGGVSALSVAFVQQYKDMLSKGLQPYVEIEYMFLTDEGKPFQPRLRRMGTLQELATT